MSKQTCSFMVVAFLGVCLAGCFRLGGDSGDSSSGGGYTSNSGTGSSAGGGCPKAEAGQDYCGYCSKSETASTNPHAGKCRYCFNSSTCPDADICSDFKCIGASTGGGSSGGSGSTGCKPGGNTPCQISCSGCLGPDQTYSSGVVDRQSCLNMYQTCVAASCSKILDNCR
jgi:hypothetical protein